MFQPELWQSHDEYRTLVTTVGRKLSRNYTKYAFDTYQKERQKLLSLNLDTITDYLSSFYSAFGRPAKNQAQILRSMILFVLLFNKTSAKTSLTTWVRETLPNSISLIVLIGCTCKLISLFHNTIVAFVKKHFFNRLPCVVFFFLRLLQNNATLSFFFFHFFILFCILSFSLFFQLLSERTLIYEFIYYYLPFYMYLAFNYIICKL